MNIPVSVIMPAYNSASFIESTLRCLVSQSLKGFEVIVVDDGSTDGTADIAERFLAKHRGDFSYRIIRSRENRGVSHARNQGIRACEGEYVHFMDSDDRVELECLEMLYGGAIRNKAEVAVCRLKWVTLDGGSIREISRLEPYEDPQIAVLSGEDALLRYLSGRLAFWPGNMLISRKLLLQNGIYFTEGMRYNEDSEFQIKVSMHSNRIVYLPKVLFYYVIRDTSQVGVAEMDREYFMKLRWLQIIVNYAIYNGTSIIVVDRLKHCYIPKLISIRSRRLIHNTPFSKEARTYLSNLARKYSYRMNGLNCRDLYYWIDNRIIAFAPSLNHAWNRATKRFMQLSEVVFGMAPWGRK